MQTLEDSLATLYKRRQISREDAIARSIHAEELESLLR
jgi:Tfp pilus assembly pilus retraction ATPase PilT